MSRMLLPEYKIVMLGSGGVGKSMLTIRYMNGNYTSEYDPTIEDSYRKQTEVDGEQCIIEITDTAGQEEYAALQDQHIRSGDCFVIVYSVADETTLSEAEKVANKVLRIKEDESTPMVLVGNKCDLQHRKVTTRDGTNLARYIKSGFFETSARENIRVEDVFKQCVRRIKNRARAKTPQSATVGEDSRSRNSPHLKYNKGLGNTKSWISGFRANKDKHMPPIATHQSLPERYMGGPYSPITSEKRHRSNTETSTQMAKRKPSEPSIPRAKRRSTTKLNGKSQPTTPKHSAPDRESIRVVPLGHDRSRTAYGDFGNTKHKSHKRDADKRSRSSSKHSERHPNKHNYSSRSVNVNKDLPTVKSSKKSAPACVIL
ncbi:Ras- protein Rap-1A [Coemansia sp. RSA 989]|nr:Ras- protein Rap-1A [Coemansia sp. RSA 1086]KAJ1753822.1 Ras- protein Rap-1A [Coemansia sp. RSA 1821]KAJ1867608.1 Ras- protein Rap-1A [Coemansia sp. RSA 989]KAJ1875873.1 Ras- protein Rap-1A [Coemansia sp. RSA 990]KAJ2676904.1 Ras- protein Rap-1A [Coemansia sp. RSA 1085]